MKVHYSIEDIPEIKNPVLTIGTFDGVHLGHQEIIALLKKRAQEIGGETVLFTFHPHPRMVLHPEDHGLKLIQSIDERIHKLESCGIDHLILFPFTREFSRISATEFVRDVLVNQINVKVITIGYNHHFGRNREGNLDLMCELGGVYDFEVQEIPAFKQNDVNISSTKVRNAIQGGEMKTAHQYLGSPFSFKGKVVQGDKIGTKIGFPTANIQSLSENQIVPQEGVYAVTVTMDGKIHQGMMNIGTRPTVSDSDEKRIEVHLFDFDEMIYDRILRLTVFDRIRSEQQFESLAALTQQLKDDKTACLHTLGQLTGRT